MASSPNNAAISKASPSPSPCESLQSFSPTSPIVDNSMYMPNFLDIVANQGAYLVPRTHTPVFEKPYDANFATNLERQLNALITTIQNVRRNKYGEIADEWPSGRTPPEIREKRQAEIEALIALEEQTSDDDTTSDDNDDSNDFDAGVIVKGQFKVSGRLLTPHRSAESIVTPHKRKRQMTFVEDGDATMMHNSPFEQGPIADDFMSNVSQGEDRKRRRRTLDVGDETEESKG